MGNDRQIERFREAVAALTPGNRDANLTHAATLGFFAGFAADEIADAILRDAPGETRPDEAAVRRAVENCHGAARSASAWGSVRLSSPSLSGRPRQRKTKDERDEEFRRSLPQEVRDSVSLFVAASRGAEPEDLAASSPTPVPADPAAQCAAFIRALGSDWRWPSWFGHICGGIKRGIVADPCEVAWRIESREWPRLPSLMSLNPLTGKTGRTKQGKPSRDCAETVAALRFLLLEFDRMPLRDQIALWTTVVRTERDRFPVVSVVFSGNKSLHAIVLCPPDNLARETIEEADRRRYDAMGDSIRRVFASSGDPAERIDDTPAQNFATHTRIPGALRPDNGRRQRLLYLDAPLAKKHLALF